MKVFVSWSDPTTRLLAEALCSWLPQVHPGLMPWMPSDMLSQVGWSKDRLTSIRESAAGLVCVTRSALDFGWVFFELGALRRCLGPQALVAPVLMDVIPEEVSPTPLHVFQAARLVRDEMWGLVRDLSRAAAAPISDGELEPRFFSSWSAFYESSRRIPGYEMKKFVVTLLLPSRSVSFTFDPGFGSQDWTTIESFVRALPKSPLGVPPFERDALHFLNVTAERWEEPPAVLSRLGAAHVAFVDQILVQECGGSSRVAAEIARASVGSKPTEWWVRELNGKLMLTRGIR